MMEIYSVFVLLKRHIEGLFGGTCISLYAKGTPGHSEKSAWWRVKFNKQWSHDHNNAGKYEILLAVKTKRTVSAERSELNQS